MRQINHTRGARRTIACVFLIALAATLALPARLAAADFPAEVVKVEDLNFNVKRIRLRASSPTFRFEAGQFVLLRLPEPYLQEFNSRYGTAHETASRPYSLASSPSEAPLFDLIVKHYPAPPGKDAPPGLASTYLHTWVKAGDKLRFGEPMGSLYAPSASVDPIIVVAGGVGASPFIGLVKYWLEQRMNDRRKIYFFWGVNSKKDLFLEDDFAAWARNKNFVYVPAIAHPGPEDNWQGETGYINAVLDRYFSGALAADVYMAGPPIMVSETIKVLTAKGVPAGRIHHDPVKVE